VIHNPTAGWRRRRFLKRVLARLARRGAAITLRETTRRGDAKEFARAARPEDFDRVVVAGGDGTINEAINGLAGQRLALAIVPLGTANVLAAEIGLGASAASVADAIVDGTTRAVSLGRVNSDGHALSFVMMAGIGFDAHVVATVDPRLKRLTGKFAYVTASLAQLLRDPGRLYDVTIDGRRHRAASAIVANGHYYGGKFVAAREARLDEPCLHVCLFGRTGRWNVMRYALALLLGQLHRLKDVTVIRAQRIEIAGPAGEPVQIDGDRDGSLPVTIEVETAGLSLAMPATAASADPRPVAAAGTA
jgi:YegS/Rv2252/BmrU family lipid kinase